MVGADRSPLAMIHNELDRVARLEAARLDLAEVNEKVAQFLLSVGDAEKRALGSPDHTDVADLATRLTVKRGLVEDQRSFVAGLQRLDLLAGLDERAHDALRRLGIVAEEIRRADALPKLEPNGLGRRISRSLPGLAGLVLLAIHSDREALRVDRYSSWP